MAKKGNLCPSCETEIVETATGPEIVNTYFAQRDLCADVVCPECGTIVNVVGRKIMTMETKGDAWGGDEQTSETEGSRSPEDTRGNAERREGETLAEAEGRASSGAAMRAAAKRHAEKVNSGERDPGANGGERTDDEQELVTDGGVDAKDADTIDQESLTATATMSPDGDGRVAVDPVEGPLSESTILTRGQARELAVELFEAASDAKAQEVRERNV